MAEVGGNDFAQLRQRGVDQKADVSGFDSRDFLDFEVAEVLLKFEDDEFSLI